MELLARIHELLDYDRWANRRVLDALNGAAEPDERALELQAHILRSQLVWIARLTAESSAEDSLWGGASPGECDRLFHRAKRELDAVLDRLTPERLSEPVFYVNSSGTAFENSVGDILLHMANHGTHHRGQIVARIRAAGEDPPVTDLIAYYRQG